MCIDMCTILECEQCVSSPTSRLIVEHGVPLACTLILSDLVDLVSFAGSVYIQALISYLCCIKFRNENNSIKPVRQLLFASLADSFHI